MNMKRKMMMVWLLILLLCTGAAQAQSRVTVQQLRQQAPQTWELGNLVLPQTDSVPVMTVAVGDPLAFTQGTFDESLSGRFVESNRYGRIPPHTALKNGLTLESAQALLNDELQRHTGLTLDDYGLIWTEIAEWKEMETWLLYYGQRFSGLTCFEAGLTMDARTETYRHMIIPKWQIQDTLFEDVPLADWSTIEAKVRQKLSGRVADQVVLELGYLPDNKQRLVPVWLLGWQSPKGYEQCYFSAQTGEALTYWKGAYDLPEPFGWHK